VLRRPYHHGTSRRSLRSIITLERRAQVRRLGALPFPRRLSWLTRWYGSDKGSKLHDYTRLYEHHLRHRRREKLTILEIGVGGEEVADAGGASLRMWRTYCPKAEIIGVDLHPKQLPVEERITILQGDQADVGFLERLAARGPFDLIIDDGSHRGEHVNITFKALWPYVNPGCLYVIEDIETAYDPAYGGGPPGTPLTSISLLKELLDATQHGEVAAIHAYKGIAFIEKHSPSA
jgi:hypothetical protein